MKAATKTVLASTVVIALCLCAVSGVTYSWWSDSENTNVDITAGGLDVSVSDYSISEYRTTVNNGQTKTETITYMDSDPSVDGIQFNLTPPAGDSVTSRFTVSYDVTFTATIEAQYMVDFIINGNPSWISNLEVRDGSTDITDDLGLWQSLNNDRVVIEVSATFDANIVQANYADVSIGIVNEIIQAGSIDTWDGSTTAAITESNNTYKVYTGAQLAWIAKQVNGGNNFSGKTVTLMKDIDLGSHEWTPIGNMGDTYTAFAGTFNGNGNTIYNLHSISQRTISSVSAGLFGAITGDIEGVNVQNAYIKSSHYAGTICAYSTANGMSITDCHVRNATVISTPNQSGNSYDNGDKAGGIIGYCVYSDTVSECSVRDSMITAFRDVGGLIGCADASTTITNNNVSNVTVIQDNTNRYDNVVTDTIDEIIGRSTNNLSATNNKWSGNTYYNVTLLSSTATVSDAEDLNDALSSGTDVVLIDDVTANDPVSGYSGRVGVIQENGGTIDGNGNTLTVNNANGTWDGAILSSGGTVKNITITGSFRGIMANNLTEDLVVDNVIIDGTTYTIHCDTAGTGGIKVSNSILNGWTSYTSGINEVTFDNCSFGESKGYAYMRPYSSTTLTDCTFSDGFQFDASNLESGGTIVMIDCYVGDTLITTDNLTTLLGDDAEGVTIQNTN